jgi:hypothetical protein
MHYFQEHIEGQDDKTYLNTLDKHKAPLPGNRLLIVFSQYTDKRQRNRFPADTIFSQNWADVIKLMQNRHVGNVRVAVYPYAAIQHTETRLDEPA